MMKLKEIIKKNEKLILILILVLFILLSIIIGSKHEPWADEAQAWLIARDTSLYSLFFKYLHMDGHPALWHIILKTLQFLKFKYKYLYLVPVFFSSLGVYLFLFKSKFKLYLKALIPFTYFIFYQYTIVARGYCLAFLLFSLLATFWEYRKNRPILFSLIMFLLINSEAYTFIFAGSIYLYLLIEFILDKDYNNNKRIISYILIFIYFLLTLLYIYPISSNTFGAHGSRYILPYSFIATSFMNKTFVLLLFIIIMFYLGYSLIKLKDNKKIIYLLLLIIPNYLFNILFYCNMWHYGFIFMIFIIYMWIFNLTENKLFNIFLIICVLVQVPWSVSSSIYDIKHTYSPAKEAASFIKEYDYNNLKIYGLSFNDSALNPYFKKNIYDNWNKDIGFFYWNTSSDYYKHNYSEQSLISEDIDIIVYSKFYFCFDYASFKDQYNYYEFIGDSYYAYRKFENQDIVILVKKEIDNKNKKEG